jgi:oxysterol-binding protein-related protein 3/6/7
MGNERLRRTYAEVLGSQHGGEQLSASPRSSARLTLSHAQVFVTGDFSISFPATGDVYSIRKPSSFVYAALPRFLLDSRSHDLALTLSHSRNLVAGTKYLELVGDLVVTNEKTGHKAVIAFKEGSAWGGSSTRNKIDGKVYDDRGDVKVELVGRWDEHIDKKEGGSHFTRLWQINEPQPSKSSSRCFLSASNADLLARRS